MTPLQTAVHPFDVFTQPAENFFFGGGGGGLPLPAGPFLVGRPRCPTVVPVAKTAATFAPLRVTRSHHPTRASAFLIFRPPRRRWAYQPDAFSFPPAACRRSCRPAKINDVHAWGGRQPSIRAPLIVTSVAVCFPSLRVRTREPARDGSRYMNGGFSGAPNWFALSNESRRMMMRAGLSPPRPGFGPKAK
jgi:hypothetical protein